MARYYLDTSALVKQYHTESGSADVRALFNAAGNQLFVSRLALVEAQSSFARLVREGEITVQDYRNWVTRLDRDAAQVLTVAAVSNQRLDEAAAILGTHGLSLPLRALDAIHLATAQALGRRTSLAAFVAADKKLLSVAAHACKMDVLEIG